MSAKLKSNGIAFALFLTGAILLVCSVVIMACKRTETPPISNVAELTMEQVSELQGFITSYGKVPSDLLSSVQSDCEEAEEELARVQQELAEGAASRTPYIDTDALFERAIPDEATYYTAGLRSDWAHAGVRQTIHSGSPFTEDNVTWEYLHDWTLADMADYYGNWIQTNTFAWVAKQNSNGAVVGVIIADYAKSTDEFSNVRTFSLEGVPPVNEDGSAPVAFYSINGGWSK